MAWNDDKDPEQPPPEPGDWDQITYDAVCICCDTYGDDPWCPACYPSQARAAVPQAPKEES
jgi:hypothetical protein